MPRLVRAPHLHQIAERLHLVQNDCCPYISPHSDCLLATMDGNGQTRDDSAADSIPLQRVAAAFLLVSILWLTFVGTTAAHELEVGALAAVVTTLFAAFVGRNCRPTAQYRFRDIIEAWRVPWYILSDIAAITITLLKDLLRLSPAQALYRVAHYTPAAPEELDLGRRVLVTAFTTATPSIIVIGIDVEQHRMLFHQLQRSSLPAMTRKLGAHA